MKLIFLASLFLLAAEWPTPSVCWPAMNQQFGGAMDTSPLSAIFGQQMLSNQMNAYGMNTMLGNGGGIGRFNPDLIQAYGSNNNNNNEQIQQRAAFSRLGNQAKSKKLSNTKFMLKPTVLVDDAPMEEAIEKFEQEFVVPSQQSPKAAAAAAAKPAAVETEKVKQQEERPAAAVKVEETPQKQEVKQQSAAESKQEVVVAEAKHDELVEKIQQQQQQQQTAAEKQADNDHPAVKALQEQEVSEFHAPAHVNYQEPFASVESAAAPQLVAPPTESVRLLNARPSMRMQQRQQQQQQQQQAYDQQFLNNEQQQQQQFQAAQATQQQQQQQSKPLKFKMAQPDNNNVGIESIRSEMTRVLSQRKNSQNVNNGFEDDDDNVAISNMPPGYNNFNKPPYFNQPVYGNLYGNGGYGGYGNNGYTAPSVNTPSYVPNSSDYVPNKPSKPNTDQLAQSFSSLIIIVNSNSNSNLGVNIIDVDLFRAFLSQFASKSVDDVLRDSSLEDKVKAFNRDHEKSSASSDSKDSDKSSGSKDSGKDKSRSRSDRNKYESTTKLSANVPTYSSEDVNPADSHSESTVLLRKNGAYSQANGNPYAYSYVPYQNGGMIVINNVNDNYNKVVKSILSGHGKSINKHDAFVLPLPINEIKRLMEDAIIVNNDNKNRNFH